MLPQWFEIEIPPAKLDGYLLNTAHKDGKSKERFFRQHGIVEASMLENLLRMLINQNKVTETTKTEFGTKYVVDGLLTGNTNAVLRTVWIVLNGENICRFVTAYPL